jgi:hypothetical protein
MCLLQQLVSKCTGIQIYKALPTLRQKNTELNLGYEQGIKTK